MSLVLFELGFLLSPLKLPLEGGLWQLGRLVLLDVRKEEVSQHFALLLSHLLCLKSFLPLSLGLFLGSLRRSVARASLQNVRVLFLMKFGRLCTLGADPLNDLVQVFLANLSDVPELVELIAKREAVAYLPSL